MTSEALPVTGPSPRVGRAAAPGRLRAVAATLALWACLVPLCILLRPYRGLVQDALIYVGRGVADRDPAGVGADMIFADDRQTGLSLLRPVVRALLAHLTSGQTSMLLVALGLLAWLAAAVALARSLAGRAAAGPAVVCILALPAQYGGWGIFAYAEAVATPRIFAEAAVLAGLAALAAERRRLGLAALALALVLHPIMALPGLAIAALLFAGDDPRWLVPVAAAGLAVPLAAALGLPLAGRLFQTFDPAWLEILQQRCPNLFPSRWSPDVCGPVACQAASAILAGLVSPPRVRRLMWAAVAVAAGGVAVSFVSGATRPNVLITQAQTWRALWPLAVLGNAGLAIAAASLWRRGRPGRLALALLALAWLGADAPAAAAALAIAAVGVHLADRRGLLPDLPPRLGAACAVVAAAAALVSLWGSAAGLLALAGAPGAPAGPALWPYVLGSGLPTVPLAAAAVASALRAPRPMILAETRVPAEMSASFRAPFHQENARRSEALTFVGAPTAPHVRLAADLGLLALAVAGLLLWDDRDGERRTLEDAAAVGALRAAVGRQVGEVLWLGDAGEAWWLAGRPAFFNRTQGAPIVFSRDLALRWADRARRLRALALIGPGDVAPWTGSGPSGEPAGPTADAVAAVCAEPADPLAAVVVPGARPGAVPAGWASSLWRPPVAARDLSFDDDVPRWRVTDAYTVIPCRR